MTTGDGTSVKRDYATYALVVLGLVGFIAYWLLEGKAFPDASIDLTVSRAQIAQKAETLAKSLGYDRPKAIQSTSFTYDDDAKNFLEYELGSGKANELMRSQIPIWYWRTRFCEQGKEEELKVFLSPDGKLEAFAHDIPKDKKLPTISRDDAEKMAREFVEGRGGVSLAEFKLIDDSSTKQLNRTDHSFVWEDQKSEIKGSRMRVNLDISGNLISNYNYYLHVPESWQRKFATIRSYNAVYEQVASYFYIFLYIALYAVFFWSVTKKEIRWRFVLPFAGLFTVVQFAEELNGFWNAVDEYQPSESYKQFVIKFFFNAALRTLYTMFSNVVMLGAAERFYRLLYPTKLACEKLFVSAGLKTQEPMRALIAAHGLFGVHLGWIVLYYIVGSKFGFWCPLGVEKYQILSSVAPFVSAIALGVQASTSEEILYRVLGLGLAQKLFKNFWIANLVQAAAWGFMHSNYPQEPPYARGIELTFAGSLYGWVIRRYGLLACIGAHYLVDAFLDVKPMFGAAETALSVPAFIPVLPFIVVILIAWYLRHQDSSIAESETKNGGAKELADLSNETISKDIAASHVPVAHVEHEDYVYAPLANRMRIAIAAAGIIGLFLVVTYKPENVGDAATVTVGRDQISKIAEKVMAEHKVKGDGFQSVTSLSTLIPSEQMQYLFEKGKLPKTLELSKITEPFYVWSVRFFKPGEPEEFTVELDGSGKEISFDAKEDEDASGPKLSKDDARKLAEDYLHAHHPEYHDATFENIAQHTRKDRIDYDVTFTSPSQLVGEAQSKLTVAVIGDYSGNFNQFWDLPDQWVWDRAKKTRKDFVCEVLRSTSDGVRVAGTFWFVFNMLKSGLLHWQPAIMFAIPIGLVSIPEQINQLPQLYSGYATTTPLQNFFTKEATDLLIAVMLKVSLATFSIAFGLACFRQIFPRLSLHSLFGSAFWPRTANEWKNHRPMWLDAVLVSFAYIAVQNGASSLYDRLDAVVSPGVPQEGLEGVVPFANFLFPAVIVTLQSFVGAINNMFYISVLAGAYRFYLKRFRFYVLAMTVYFLIAFSTERYWQNYGVEVFQSVVQCIFSWFYIVKVARLNIALYLIYAVNVLLCAHIDALWRHGAPLFQSDILFMVAVVCLPIFYAVYLLFKRPPI